WSPSALRLSSLPFGRWGADRAPIDFSEVLARHEHRGAFDISFVGLAGEEGQGIADGGTALGHGLLGDSALNAAVPHGRLGEWAQTDNCHLDLAKATGRGKGVQGAQGHGLG